MNGEGCLVDMNEVYVRIGAAHKDQPAIPLLHMEERFGGIVMQERERVHAQHKVPTNHFANMGGWMVVIVN